MINGGALLIFLLTIDDIKDMYEELASRKNPTAIFDNCLRKYKKKMEKVILRLITGIQILGILWAIGLFLKAFFIDQNRGALNVDNWIIIYMVSSIILCPLTAICLFCMRKVLQPITKLDKVMFFTLITFSVIVASFLAFSYATTLFNISYAS